MTTRHDYRAANDPAWARSVENDATGPLRDAIRLRVAARAALVLHELEPTAAHEADLRRLSRLADAALEALSVSNICVLHEWTWATADDATRSRAGLPPLGARGDVS
jgi:hypothetical protein